jgi:hypothetical protein
MRETVSVLLLLDDLWDQRVRRKIEETDVYKLQDTVVRVSSIQINDQFRSSYWVCYFIRSTVQ